MRIEGYCGRAAGAIRAAQLRCGVVVAEVRGQLRDHFGGRVGGSWIERYVHCGPAGAVS